MIEWGLKKDAGNDGEKDVGESRKGGVAKVRIVREEDMREGLHIDDWKWPAVGGAFRVVGDNQTMINILNGETACERQDLAKELEECANRLAEIVLHFGAFLQI